MKLFFSCHCSFNCYDLLSNSLFLYQATMKSSALVGYRETQKL
jgi:hypothetical protein